MIEADLFRSSPEADSNNAPALRGQTSPDDAVLNGVVVAGTFAYVD
ncbi:hypothetical protein LZC95_48490 [Pendulispora brunnea]|uniref:Uncharacterized protein n=1 Tax=Pendulispora brunnea TaxID=2905690 RepID=A0ABZ2K6H5_9BACT